jgi:hypothetical protein
LLRSHNHFGERRGAGSESSGTDTHFFGRQRRRETLQSPVLGLQCGSASRSRSASSLERAAERPRSVLVSPTLILQAHMLIQRIHHKYMLLGFPTDWREGDNPQPHAAPAQDTRRRATQRSTPTPTAPACTQQTGHKLSHKSQEITRIVFFF